MQTVPAKSSSRAPSRAAFASPTGEPWRMFLSLLPLRGFFAASSRLAPAWAASVARRLFCTPRGPRGLQIARRTDMRLIPTHEEFAIAHREQTVYGRAWGLDRRRPRVLLAHGWAGWGLQFSEFVQPLLDAGFEVITFDQPAHGASTGKTITLPEFARVIATMDRNFGPFHAVIGHSLGGAATAFALSRGLRAKKAVLISAPADAEAETRRFARALWIPDAARAAMQKAIEEDEGVRLNELRALTIAPQLKQPALLVHDRRDREVAVTALAEYDAWPGATVVTTEGLGHVRILRDEGVIRQVVEFVAAR